MDGLPVTHGYTINVVKEKSKSAIIFLSPPGKVAVTLSSENKNVDNYIVPEILASNSILKTNARSPSESYTRITDYSVPCEASDNADQVLFYEEVFTGPGDGNVQYFSDVAHEEVVVEEEEYATAVASSRVAGIGQEVPVHCDLCNSVFSPMEDIKGHMISAHNMLSFEGGCTATVYCILSTVYIVQNSSTNFSLVTASSVATGPCFKCDFCSVYVTDRVSHMKRAHYSALANTFTKRDNSYHCRQCSYTSDQLTNIRSVASVPCL